MRSKKKHQINKKTTHMSNAARHLELQHRLDALALHDEVELALPCGLARSQHFLLCNLRARTQVNPIGYNLVPIWQPIIGSSFHLWNALGPVLPTLMMMNLPSESIVTELPKGEVAPSRRKDTANSGRACHAVRAVHAVHGVRTCASRMVMHWPLRTMEFMRLTSSRCSCRRPAAVCLIASASCIRFATLTQSTSCRAAGALPERGSIVWLSNRDQMSYSLCQIGPTVSY
jgi:hypothetical protein